MKTARFAVSLLCLLAACAPVTMSPQGSSVEVQQETERQKALVYKQMVTDNERIFNVSFPILAANAQFCERVAPGFGLTMWNVGSQKADFRQTARNVFNLQDRVAAQFVADRSPAGRAGIQSGDFVVSINGEELSPGDNAVKDAYAMLDGAGDNQITLRLERNGKQFNAAVKPVKVCAYPVVLDYESNELNAYTDGSKIVISKGIVRLTRNDNELALIIAHELGHDAMGHINKQRTNAMLGGLGGLAIDAVLASAGVSTGNQFGQAGQQMAGSAYSVQFEQEADYVGMYFMERAGYNSTGVADFWRRMAAENPTSIMVRSSHPTSPERFIALDRTHSEIAKKKASGEPLVPNMKPTEK